MEDKPFARIKVSEDGQKRKRKWEPVPKWTHWLLVLLILMFIVRIYFMK